MTRKQLITALRWTGRTEVKDQRKPVHFFFSLEQWLETKLLYVLNPTVCMRVQGYRYGLRRFSARSPGSRPDFVYSTLLSCCFSCLVRRHASSPERRLVHLHSQLLIEFAPLHSRGNTSLTSVVSSFFFGSHASSHLSGDRVRVVWSPFIPYSGNLFAMSTQTRAQLCLDYTFDLYSFLVRDKLDQCRQVSARFESAFSHYPTSTRPRYNPYMCFQPVTYSHASQSIPYYWLTISNSARDSTHNMHSTPRWLCGRCKGESERLLQLAHVPSRPTLLQ